ncbi:UDP-glucose 4-epimerase GalE [Maricaulis sp.]|uniref:UDP-glucose 4-epimerase GalE n=1 Tax=Maricaulis sp. TaxID=1486257 RepID=UPI001B04E27E|nr:UDP-glucose 4-epimerase GalE [Maricaulis sp.]MBO6798557.1 UDP-glucose 4-epimerase GalE [Maricaulis sp.]
MTRKILVLGGAGYIGAHVAKAIALRGDVPIVMDNLSSGRSDFVKWGPLVKADIRETAALDAVFRTFRPDAVMHFAASIEVGLGETDPIGFWNNNVAGALNVLEAMQLHSCRSFVFSSTCAVYGNPERLPLFETHSRRPINTYGRTKLAIEQALEDAARAGHIDYAVLRYFNASGASPDGEIGEEHDPETHLIPLALFAAHGTGAPLKVFGSDYETADGSCIRDYIHVSDLARGHLRALDRLFARQESFTCNLGTGQGVSVFEVLQAVERVTGRKVPFSIAPRRDGDPAALYANIEYAKHVLGFVTHRSTINQIVQDAWNYHRHQPGADHLPGTMCSQGG